MFKVLATGQSNMLGRGFGGESPIKADSRVQVWNNRNEVSSTVGDAFIAPPAFGDRPWEETNDANNPAIWFCDRAAKELDDEVRLVFVAQGGRPISRWARGDTLYNNIENSYTASGLDPADVLLWAQGESDGTCASCTNIGKAAYKSAFLTVVSNLRQDGFLAQDAPVIIGEIRWFEAQDINEALIELAQENANIFFAPSEGMRDYDDVHYEGASLVHLGRYRYWEQYRDKIGFERISGSVTPAGI